VREYPKDRPGLTYHLTTILSLALATLAPAASANEATALFGKGNQLVQKRLFEEAATQFEHALEIEPGLNAARYQLAICYFALGRNDESLRQFERLKKEVGPAHEVLYYLGRLRLLGGNEAAAIVALLPLADDPKIPDAAYYLGSAYAAAGDQTNGIKWLERAAQAQAHDYHVHYRLARAYSSAGRKADADREYALYNQYRNAERETEARMRACSAALDAQAAAQIAEACGHAADANDPEKLVLLGQLYGDHAHYAEAVEPLERAVKLDPGSFDAWHNLGLSYFRLKRYAEAREPLEKAVRMQPDFFDTLNLLGATLYVLGDDRAALPVLERAHQLHPDDAQLNAALDQLRHAH
jgi:tetratricopeptide (TPR) repeat protein